MIPIVDLVQQHRGLVNELARYDYASVAPLVGGFLTQPSFHANTLRLDALAQLACYACTGKRSADREMLVRCAGRHFVDSSLITMEDPIEDAFIGNIATGFGNFRVFRGIEESGDFWAERILYPFEAPNVPEPLKPIIKHVQALLMLSDAVTERLKLKRYTFGSGRLRGRLEIPQWRELISAANAVTFSLADLQQLAIAPENLVPFILAIENRSRLLDQTTGHTDFERYPIIQFGNKFVVAAPHAITASVRRFIIEELKKSGFLGVFDTLLHTRQVEDWFATLRHNIHFKSVEVALPKVPSDFPPLYQTVMQFDEGKYAHLMLLDGNIEGHLTFAHEMDQVTDQQQHALEQHILACSDILKKLPNYSGGMTVTTRGGVGRGLFLGYKNIPKDWDILFASLPDWYTLAGCQDMSALRLWRMSRQQRWAEERGLRIQNINGLLNLYACWRANGWRFFLREMPMATSHKVLAVEIDFLTKVRKEVENAQDNHACPAHDGRGWIRVQRRYPKASYSKDRNAPMYIALGAMDVGALVGSIEAPGRIWWIATKMKSKNVDARSVVFQLWDCLLNWMEYAVPIIERRMVNLPSQSVWIEIQVGDPEKWSDHVPENFIQKPTAYPNALTNSTERKIILTIPMEFKNEFHIPENRAEQMLIACVLSAISEMAGNSLSDSERNHLLSEIFPNIDARFFHVVRTENLAQMLGGNGRPSPDFIPEEDCAQSLIGLADEVGGIPASGKIRGVTECMDYLQKVVDKLWERIERSLGSFNRKAVVTSCFSALAELERDGEHWSMTARALLALQKDDTEILQEAEERRSYRDAASLTNRLLIETAMYACLETGGKLLPCAERMELLAHLDNLLSAANHRDAISGGFMPAQVHVFPNGELDVDAQFYASVMKPYSQAVFTKAFRSSARSYEKWFSNYERPEDPNAHETLDRMEQPFQEEFGLTLDQFVPIHHHFGRLAIKTQKLFLEFDEPSLIAFLKNECHLDGKSANAYLAHFSLLPRRAWNKDMPSGCKDNDVWPWRFRRQLSLVMRPLVLLTNKPAKQWLVYPPVVERSAAYLINGLSEAAFPTEHFQSKAMIKFCGDQANRQGNQFTHQVADRSEQLGFTARREVSMCALGVPASAGDYGDVDVLAWRDGSPNVFVIECKCLRMAATVREVVDRLDQYRGECDDSLAKHLRRLTWLESNPAAVITLTGIPIDAIRFKGLLVTDDLVPMQFFSGSQISPRDVVAFNHLADALK